MRKTDQEIPCLCFRNDKEKYSNFNVKAPDKDKKGKIEIGELGTRGREIDFASGFLTLFFLMHDVIEGCYKLEIVKKPLMLVSECN
ncbi:unnamed protein product [Cylicocyclus nassatus]|uniref:Uncharacterized protein n=1 Tax=Cylicocyclus nassatus TaxID=53992 RepID=A0AA36GM16_CYLNA|nr:unnamed protein product [Cylicocyclus nassatus]